MIHPKLQLCVWLWIPRKESQMDHGQLSMVADKFQWVCAASLLNACGTDAQFCRRERSITPLRLGLALTATCASQRVETRADCHRGFQALWETSLTSKAFYNHGAKTHLADFARPMTERLSGAMTLKGLGFHKGQACAEFASPWHPGWQLIGHARRLARGLARTFQSRQARGGRAPCDHGLAL